jgi:cardiolipin synthase
MGAAITDSRVLAPAEARTVAVIALILFILAGVAVWWPRVLTVPFAILAAWIAVVLLLRAYALWKKHRH